MLSPVTVLARLTAKAGLEDAVFSELVTLVEHTRREDGCISYDLYRSDTNPALFIFHEIWRSREDLERHFQTAHLLDFRHRAADMLTAPAEISFWNRAC